jgi:hypothetical protein
MNLDVPRNLSKPGSQSNSTLNSGVCAPSARIIMNRIKKA